MVKRFLVTTALKETWRDDEPVLFLGEWWRLYSSHDLCATLAAAVLPVPVCAVPKMSLPSKRCGMAAA